MTELAGRRAQEREAKMQAAERAEEARREAVVERERVRLLLATPHLRSFLPPGTLTRADRAALEAASVEANPKP